MTVLANGLAAFHKEASGGSEDFPFALFPEGKKKDAAVQNDKHRHRIEPGVLNAEANVSGELWENGVEHSHPRRNRYETEIACGTTDLNTVEAEQLVQHDLEILRPVDACIHELFSRQVTDQPTSPCISAWDGDLSYIELARLADKFARYLRSAGVNRGSLVLLCFEKSIWMTVSIMSVLKAGGAVVPLDAGHRVQRLLEIVKDTKAGMVICGPRLSHHFVNRVAKIVSDIPALLHNLCIEGEPISTEVQPSDPAFILFTSGSTGKAKGIVHTHSSICSSIIAYAPALKLTRESRVLQFSNYSFDIAILDTISSLIIGACLCVPSEDERLNDITGYIRRSRSTWAFLTPSFSTQVKPEDVPSLTTLVLGGEEVPKERVKAWASATRQVFNGYGPAECAICVVNALTPDLGTGIGRGVGCLTWVVEESNYTKLAPDRRVGELLIEGPGVFAGYLQDDVKTHMAFLENPPWLSHAENGRRRLYKTGDLVRREPDGTLIYVGRRDMQIKLRGQRIEIGEVEHRIRQILSGNGQVAVELVEPRKGDPRLTAFLTVDDSSLDIRALAAQIGSGLESVLPSFMVPSTYVPIAALPRNHNSKLDRHKLRSLGSELSFGQIVYPVAMEREPKRLCTRDEHRLAALWTKILNLESPVEAHDHFFMRGGSSLSCISLVSAAREEGLQISVAEIFQHPILSDMALVLRSTEATIRSCRPFELVPSTTLPLLYQEAMSQCQSPRENIEDIYPCTPMQEGLFAVSMRLAGNYIAQFVYDIPKNVDQRKFQAAWLTVISQNPILRSRIIGASGRSYQVVVKSLPTWHEVTDVDFFLAAERKQVCQHGSSLLSLGSHNSSTSCKFVLSIHHAIFDGFSLQLIWNSVARAYLQIPAKPPVHFAPFVQSLCADQDFEESSRHYWHEQLQGSTAASFPTVPYPNYTPQAKSSLSLQVPLSEMHSEVTTSQVIRAAWALLLGQYCRSKDVTFGMTVSGRFAASKGIDEVVGPTITSVPVRVRINHEASVRSFLKAVQDQAVEMIQFEQVGLPQISKSCGDAQESCKFTSLLVIQPAEDFHTTPSVRLFEREPDIGLLLPHLLVVECHLQTDGVQICTSYDPSVLQYDEVRRLAAQLGHILQQLWQIDRGTKLSNIDLLSRADRTAVSLWNRHLPPAEEFCIHERFQAQVLLRPSAEAVCAWDGSLTYHELDLLSSRLAYYLLNHGVQSGMTIPLCLDKSKWVIISLLAVLKLGGACLFLEASWPRSRIDFMIESVEAVIVIADPQHSSLFQGEALTLLPLSPALLEEITMLSKPLSLPPVDPHNSAFVMFTSGSTGIPKGIVQEHSALYTSAHNHASTCNVSPSTRSLQYSSFAFDVYQIEICTTLTHGGCICVPSEYDRMNNLALVMEEMRVNWVFFTPSFCRSMDPRQMPQLQTLLVGGEAVDKATIDKWRGHVLLLNCYGPAECGPSVMCEITPSHRNQSIGNPLCVVCWIVDPDDHEILSPVGAVGELLLEGYTMARCYLNQPDKSKASFIKPPRWLSQFGPGRGPRLYKTGDLVKYHVDGSIDYLGRKDLQVKVRGQRVELGEVEHHLRNCIPAIVEVAADTVQIEKSEGRTTLVAFFSLKEGNPEDKFRALALGEDSHDYKRLASLIEGFQSRIENSAPSSMVPGAVLLLSDMPINSSGKLDRKRLKALAREASLGRFHVTDSAHQGCTPPRTTMEITLQDLWKKTISTLSQPLYLESNWFHVGADSISSINLVASARAAGLSLSVQQIFINPKLIDMATQLRPLDTQSTKALDFARFDLLAPTNAQDICKEIANTCNIAEDAIDDVYPCTPLQEGLFALSTLWPGTYMSQNVYSLAPSIDRHRFRTAWDLALQQHSILRTRVIQTPHGLFQAVMLETIHWQTIHDFDKYTRADREQHMTNGLPMARLALSSASSDGSSRFVITLHHCLYDLWSMKNLWKTVRQNYLGLPIATSAPFKHFIHYLLKSDFEASRCYWRQQLADISPTVFPEVQPGYQPLARSFIKHPHLCTLPAETPTSSATLSTYIQAAWSLIVATHCSTDDVTIGNIVSGRSAPVKDIDSTVAPTITTVPVRTRIIQQGSVPDFVEQLQTQAAEMLGWQQTGLQNIKRCINTEVQGALDLQNLLVIQPMLNDQIVFPGVECLSDGSDFVVPHALLIVCSLTCDSIRIESSFDENVISADRVARLLRQLDHLIRELWISDPSTQLRDLDITPLEERKEIISANYDAPESTHRCVHHIIQEMAKESPHAIAVQSWDGRLTYNDLDDISDRLSIHLRQLGVKQGRTLPLLFEKSMWAVVALLGTIKAGAAFVLVDESVSLSRLEHIVRVVDARLALSSPSLAARLQTLQSLDVFTVDRSRIECIQFSPSHMIPVTSNPRDVLCVQFTSGTTSTTPKAAVLEHVAYTTAAVAHARLLGIDKDTRCLQWASYFFDGALVEIMSTLMHGGTVCIPTESDRQDNIDALVRNNDVNHLTLTPSVARAIIGPLALKTLGTLNLVGEPMTKEDFNYFQTPGLKLLNGYGLTECCVCSAISEVAEDTLGVIGAPIASRFWVVDPDNHDRLAPIGTTGELLIESQALAREYLNDRARTATSFVNDPPWAQTLRPMRLYKTGDLVRARPDGKLLLLGRKDAQTKLRGQRIDLTEVESVLRQALGKNNVDIACETILPKGTSGAPALAAFVHYRQPTAHHSIETLDLSSGSQEQLSVHMAQTWSHLQANLPTHMVPSFCFSVTCIPLTFSGKVDRKTLAALAKGLDTNQLAAYSPNAMQMRRIPSSRMEILLSQVWSQILGVQESQIGADDSFFLFGDSIYAIRLTAALRECGLVLAAADIIAHPILSEMAGLVKEKSPGLEDIAAVPFALIGGRPRSVIDEVARQCNVNASDVQDIYPCTPLQEGLMALSVKTSGSYIARNVLSLPPGLDVESFMMAWTQVVDENPILRTRIVQTKSHGTLQVVLRESLLWSRGADLSKYLESSEEFKMGLGTPLNHFALVAGTEGQDMVWISHHASYDAWSTSLIFEQVDHIYHSLPRVKILPFSRYIEYLATQDNERAGEYWRSLSDSKSVVAFPVPQAVSYKPHADTAIEYIIDFNASFTSADIQAAWAFISARYMDVEDVVYGLVMNGRTVPLLGVEQIAGPTITTMPFPVHVGLDDTIDVLIQLIKTRSAEMTHANMGLQDIRRLSSQAELMCNFQTLLVIQPDMQMNCPCGTTASSSSTQDLSTFNSYGLMLEVRQKAHRLIVTASFDQNLIPQSTMRRILRQFGYVLDQLVNRSGSKKLADINLATQEDIQEIKGHQNKVPAARESLVQDIIVAQVTAHPEKVAIDSWDGKLTYGQLHDLSSRLATYISRESNVKRCSIVPICFEKSMWAVVCLLAVLKSGAAVLLLDPAHPLARLQEIVQEAGAELVLCDTKSRAKIRSSLVVEVTRAFVESLPSSPYFDLDVQPEDTAFIISTSGSTGKPKLIIHTHKGICTAILAYSPQYKISDQSRILHFAAPSFDICINEIVAALFSGGVLVIPDEEERINNVAACINDKQVNWLFAVPSFIRHIGLSPMDVPSLETLVLGGESGIQDLVDDWKDEVNLWTAYGPAECQICTVGPLLGPRNIGHANGCICWVVDPHNIDSLMPLGMAGELIIQGPVVARGYLNAENEAFRIAPVWLRDYDQPNVGIYRTGDIVKYSSNGSLTYIGRKDDTQQVKVRGGQRLDLGEVEYHVRRCLSDAHVAAAVVNIGERPALVVFLSKSVSGRHLTDKVAEKYLRHVWQPLHDSLPRYMIPTGFFCLDTIPLTSSGKTDRKKLQAMKLALDDLITETTTEEPDRAPLSVGEETLKLLWMDVLNVEPHEISCNSNFFRLGGDSILAIRLVSAARLVGLGFTVSQIFENPKLCDMALVVSSPVFDEDPAPFSLIADMTPAVLAQAADQCRLQMNEIEDIYPCTPLQEGLFALSQQTGAYIARSVFDLPAGLDLDKFKYAWEQTRSQIAMLRMAIVQSSSNGLLQVISKQPLPWHESSSLDLYLSNNNLMQPGDPLTQFAVIDRRHFVLSQHHAAYDGISLPQVFSQVENVYRGISLDSVRAPYSRFVKFVLGLDSDKAKQYWAREMAGASWVPFPIVRTGYKPNPSSYLKSDIQLRETGSETTKSTLLRAAWAFIVSSYVNSSNITFGVTLSGRQAAVSDIEHIIGPTITTIPVRVSLDPDLTVHELLQVLQQPPQYEQYGLQNIQKSSPESKAAGEFNNLLIIHPEPRLLMAKDSVHVPYAGSVHRDTNFRTYALNIECTLMDKTSVAVEAFFDSKLIDQIQMRRILGQFDHVLQQLSDAEHLRLRDLELISPQDRRDIEKWHSTSPVLESETCVHHLIAQQIQSQPTRSSVCAWDGDLTYAQLDHLSSRVAYNLSSLGVIPRTMVPLCFEKSLWMIVAIMAVMKAGGCFVPLDPSHPKQRLLEIIKQTQAQIIITSSRYESLVESTFEVSEQALAQMTDPPTSSWSQQASRPGDPLYTIFTSGSTGQPKGVVIEHSAFCAGSDSRRHLLKLDRNSRSLQYSSYSFDVSVEDMLSTLLAGGTVCVPSEEERLDDLAKTMQKMQVNYANLTPTVASLLHPDDVPSLKVLALGGEPMTQTHVDTWSKRVHLMNFYGPTECSVTVCLNHEVTPNTPPRSIGHAVGCTAWIVQSSDFNKLAPLGGIGELLIEGPVLARGYLHDDAKTRQAFIEYPRWAEEPKRLYRTGDLVRYDSDGSILYVGRLEDSMVKYHGQRVELGEVEYHLRASIPEVRNVAADILEQSSKGVALAAFVDLAPEETDQPCNSILESIVQRLRTQLPQNLPEHMIPKLLVAINGIPMSLAGKTDRRRLRQAGQELLSAGEVTFIEHMSANKQQPSNDTEKQLQAIWAEILNVPLFDIGINTSFLTCGGDSITAIQVVARCRGLGLPVTTANVMQQKTIANICKNIQLSGLIKQQPQHSEIVYDSDYQLSPIQREQFLLMPTGNNKFQQSFLLSLLRPVSAKAIKDTIDQIVSVHPMLRSRFSKHHNGHWAQRVLEPSSDSYLFEHHVNGKVEEVRLAADNAIDIVNGPVLAACLIDSAEGQFLYLTIHHLVIDLVSWRIILYDLEQQLLDPTKSLPGETLPFQTWCGLQVGYMSSSLNPKTPIPIEAPPASGASWDVSALNNTYENATSKSFTIDEVSTKSLLGACNSPLRTETVEILLAAIFHSYHKCFPDRGNLSLLSEGHGREPWDDSLDLSRTVGWFTTMAPLEVEGSSDIVDVLARAKDVRRNLASNGWSYFTSHHLLQDSHKPLEADVVFNFQGQYQQLERQDAIFQHLPIENPSFARPGSNVKMPAAFEISAVIFRERIRFDFIFNRDIAHQDCIEDWIQQCQQSLYQAACVLAQTEARHTRSDFPLLDLDPQGFDGLTNEILPKLPSKVEDIYPCSSMQKKMHRSQIAKSGCYEIIVKWEANLSSHETFVDVQRLRDAWVSLVEHHPILRTCIVDIQDQVIQIVLQDYQPDTLVLDESDQELQTPLFCSTPLSSRPFRPMHRLTLKKQATGATRCQLEISHVLIDGTSLNLLLQQLLQSYSSKSTPAIPSPPYSDFIRHLRSHHRESLLSHWKRYIATATPCLIPTTTPRPEFTSSASLPINLSPLSPSITTFCRHNGTTLSTFFHTVWALVLRTYTAQEDITFGHLVSGRDVPIPNISSLIGPVFNLLPCAVHISKDMTMLEALEALHADNVQNIPHHDFSLPEILDDGAEKLFNTLINFRKYTTNERNSKTEKDGPASIAFSALEGYDPFDYDIVVEIAEQEGNVSVVLSYWRSRIGEERIRDVAGRFGGIVDRMVKESDGRVAVETMVEDKEERIGAGLH